VPITPTRKIWLDGELVDWDKARIHVLHALAPLRVGGVRRHPAAYPTAAAWRCSDSPTTVNPAVHLQRSVHSIDMPYSPDELIRASKEVVRVNGLHEGCYLRPIVYLGYGEMGLNPLPCPVSVAIAAWPWGTYLGAKGGQRDPPQGVHLAASRPQRRSHGGQGDGHVRELVAGQGRGAEGRYDEAVCSRPTPRVGVHGREHLRGAGSDRGHSAHVGVGALAGITQDSVRTIRH